MCLRSVLSCSCFSALLISCTPALVEEAAEVEEAVLAAEAARVKPPKAEDGVVSGPTKGVVVTTSNGRDRHCEVFGVFDFHTSADSEEKGFAELRHGAAVLGANAVVSAEFEHGEAGERSHLSGMAARCAPLS